MKKISFSFPQPPAPPAPPAPPMVPAAFPVALPGSTPPVLRPQRSLFKDMFGTDHSVLAMALDSEWANPDQKELALQVLSGQKSVARLSAEEQEVLDGIVHSYDHSKESRSHDQVQTASERLSVSGDDRERGEDLQSGSNDGMQNRSSDSDSGPDFSDAYSWTK